MLLQKDHASKFSCVRAANIEEEGRDGEIELLETLHRGLWMSHENKEKKSNNLKSALWLLTQF